MDAKPKPETIECQAAQAVDLPPSCSAARQAAYATIAAATYGGALPAGHRAWLDAQSDEMVIGMADCFHPSPPNTQISTQSNFMAQPTPTKAGLELMATYPQDDEGKRMCMRSKLDGIARGVRMFVDIAYSGPHKGMLCLWRDRNGMKKGSDEITSGKRKTDHASIIARKANQHTPKDN